MALIPRARGSPRANKLVKAMEICLSFHLYIEIAYLHAALGMAIRQCLQRVNMSWIAFVFAT